MRPRVGGLFAGYGGLERALHDVFAAEPAWFSEIDKAPSAILAHHWPDVPNLGDITRVDWSTVEPVDIVAGGSPCQDLSHAGKRMGMRPGTRSGLWASMLDAVRVLRPSLVVWENVRGALSAEATSELEPCAGCVGGDDDGPVLRALGRVLGDLAGVGYDAAWTGLRAADVGAPHGRFRIFVVAWPTSDPAALSWPTSDPAALSWPTSDPAALLPTPAVNDMGASYTPEGWDEWTARMQARHGNGNGHGASLSIEALRLLPSPRTSDTNGAGEHGQGGLDLRTAVSLLPTPRATRGGSGTETMYGLGAERSDDDRPQGQVLLPTPKATNNENRSSGWASGPNLGEAIRGDWGVDFGQYAPAIARWEALTRPAPSPTEPTGRGGARRLSPAFVEWMQGLSAGWVTAVPGITRNDELKALGNGVVPQQGAEGVRRCLTIGRTYALGMTPNREAVA